MHAILECKQCGGVLSPEEGQKIVYCKFCGSANVVSLSDRAGLYNRANYLRRQNEFDRAISIYEDIVREDPSDAEGYYGLALCKYGIEYVDDPLTEKKIPTCHRTRLALISHDSDFQKAIECADSESRAVYLEEAEKIDIILKNIQKLSSTQEKYDIFISYKESDGQGGRTGSSVLAQDIYENLTNKGYRVFFSRKTLENKLGSEYEPIIFSALYSAKVMLVVGTKPEEFQAVWVKNEWVRFIERLSNGEDCHLIPLYKDFSPYELPDEMVNIQSLDMSKIGFMQDLNDGIRKLIPRDSSPSSESNLHVQDSTNPDGLRRRGWLFLEQGDFSSALQYFDRVLDNCPEDSNSYWGKLLAGLSICQENELENLNIPISDKQDYQLALQFAGAEEAAKFKRYADFIDTKLYEAQKKKEEEERQREEQKRLELEEKKRKLAEQKLEQKENNKKMRKRLIKVASTLAIVYVLWVTVFCIVLSYLLGVVVGRAFRKYEVAGDIIDGILDDTWVYQGYSGKYGPLDYLLCEAESYSYFSSDGVFYRFTEKICYTIQSSIIPNIPDMDEVSGSEIENKILSDKERYIEYEHDREYIYIGDKREFNFYIKGFLNTFGAANKGYDLQRYQLLEGYKKALKDHDISYIYSYKNLDDSRHSKNIIVLTDDGELYIEKKDKLKKEMKKIVEVRVYDGYLFAKNEEGEINGIELYSHYREDGLEAEDYINRMKEAWDTLSEGEYISAN